MSVHITQQLQQELQNELITSNRLLQLISIELQQIKELTKPGGDLDTNVVENASIMQRLGSTLQIDLKNTTPLPRMTTDLSRPSVLNESNEPHNTLQDTTVNGTK